MLIDNCSDMIADIGSPIRSTDGPKLSNCEVERLSVTARVILSAVPDEHSLGAVRNAMNEDLPGGALIDVTGLTLDEQLTEADESALARALARLLASDDDACNDFQASI